MLRSDLMTENASGTQERRECKIPEVHSDTSRKRGQLHACARNLARLWGRWSRRALVQVQLVPRDDFVQHKPSPYTFAPESKKGLYSGIIGHKQQFH